MGKNKREGKEEGKEKTREKKRTKLKIGLHICIFKYYLLEDQDVSPAYAARPSSLLSVPFPAGKFLLCNLLRKQ